MKILLVSLVALFPFSLFADSYGTAGLPSQPYIYVAGTATEERAPDTITVFFDLVGRDADQAKANQDVQTRSSKAFALLHDLKIADTDVIAEEITSEAEFEQTDNNSQKRGKLIGYSVTRPFTVKLRDVSTFGKLVNSLIKSVNAEIRRSHTSFSKEDEISKELWNKAIIDAREQADRTAKQTGMKVDSVFAISPTPIPEITSTMFPKGGGVERVVVTGSNVPTPEEWEKYRLAPISFSETVQIIYLISPAASPVK
jgi:uncharacterized protein YggE